MINNSKCQNPSYSFYKYTRYILVHVYASYARKDRYWWLIKSKRSILVVRKYYLLIYLVCFKHIYNHNKKLQTKNIGKYQCLTSLIFINILFSIYRLAKKITHIPGVYFLISLGKTMLNFLLTNSLFSINYRTKV